MRTFEIQTSKISAFFLKKMSTRKAAYCVAGIKLGLLMGTKIKKNGTAF